MYLHLPVRGACVRLRHTGRRARGELLLLAHKLSARELLQATAEVCAMPNSVSATAPPHALRRRESAVVSAWDLGEAALSLWPGETWSRDLERRLRTQWEASGSDVKWAVVSPIAHRAFELRRRHRTAA
jgi:hypothetical protein